MPHRKCKTVYYFDELSAEAKEVVLDRWRVYDDPCPDWHESTVDDFIQIAEILGVSIECKPVKLMGGGTRQKPVVWFSGLDNRSGGVSFAGCYAYSTGWRKKLAAYAPLDKDLLEIGMALQKAQVPVRYGAYAEITTRHGGNILVRVGYMDVSPSNDATDCAIEDALRSLADWLYHRLQEEYEYQTSAEVISEQIRDGEHEFTAGGLPA